MKNFISHLFIGFLIAINPLLAQVNGALDSTFGTNGAVHYDISGLGYAQLVSAAKFGPDGKFYVAGSHGTTNNYQMFATRFNADGTLDSTFGSYGTAFINPLISNVAHCNAMDIQPDGKVVLAGNAHTNDQENVILRLNTDGTLDTSFNHTGILAFVDANSSDSWHDVLVQTDGKIVAVGVKDLANGGDKAMLRLNPDGSFDSTFGNNGKAIFDEGGSETFYEVEHYAPNRYHITGYHDGERNITELNGTGGKILTFANSGVLAIGPFLGKTPIITRMQTTMDGKMWLSGDVRQGGIVNSFFCRLLSDGSYDTTFSGDGVFIEDMSPNLEDGLRDFEILPDGQIFLAGEYESPNDSFNLWTMIINQQGYVNTSYGIGGAFIYQVGSISAMPIIQRDGDNNIWIACATNRNGDKDITIIKLKTTDNVGIAETIVDIQDVAVYPNPVSAKGIVKFYLHSHQTLTVSIVDVAGKEMELLLEHESLPTGEHTLAFDASTWASGIYLVQVVSQSGQLTKRILTIK